MADRDLLFTPVGTGGYCRVFKAYARKKNGVAQGRATFSLAVLFDAAAMASPAGKALDVAARAAAREKFGSKAADMIEEGKVDLPWRKDIKSKGYPAWCVAYINLSSGEDYPPTIRDHAKKIITDQREIYDGVLLRASVSVRAYEKDGGKGVIFDLANIQKVGDGPKLKLGGGSDGDEFGEVEKQDTAPAEEDDFDKLAS